MPIFRKKPVVVHADVYQRGMEDGTDLVASPRMYCEQYDEDECEDYVCECCEFCTLIRKPYIKTLEGKLYISEGDYIITGVQGERYPCKPDIFKATYEEVISIIGSEDSIIVKEDAND